jgi:hypothetical protein
MGALVFVASGGVVGRRAAVDHGEPFFFERKVRISDWRMRERGREG